MVLEPSGFLYFHMSPSASKTSKLGRSPSIIDAGLSLSMAEPEIQQKVRTSVPEGLLPASSTAANKSNSKSISMKDYHRIAQAMCHGGREWRAAIEARVVVGGGMCELRHREHGLLPTILH